MKANELKELRIGNVIRWDMNDPLEDNEPEQGYIDTPLEIWHLEYPERISGILLSDYDTISKLLNYKECNMKQEQVFENNFYKWNITLQIGRKQFQFKTTQRIEYFHDLQDIYFKLTGNELEIKL